MNGIGWAVKQMEDGQRVRRAGWNGKGMYIEKARYDMQGSFTLPFAWMFTATGDTVPWLCSQTDLFATDWELAD